MSRFHVSAAGRRSRPGGDGTQRAGPERPRPPRSPRARWPRILLGVGLALVLLAGLAVAGLKTLSHRYDRTVTKEQLLDADARTDRTDLDGPLNYLLIGSDRRPGDSGDGPALRHHPHRARPGRAAGGVPDLHPARPAGRHPARERLQRRQDKINAAYEHGGGGQAGAQLLSATLHRLTGIRFDGAALVDFSGFRKVVDLLGGVEMCVDTEVRSIHTDRAFTTGCQQMDGGAGARLRPPALRPARTATTTGSATSSSSSRRCCDRAAAPDLRSNPVKLDQVHPGGRRLADRRHQRRTPGGPAPRAARTAARRRCVGVQAALLAADHRRASRTWCWTTAATGSSRPSARGTTVPAWASANPRWVNPVVTVRRPGRCRIGRQDLVLGSRVRTQVPTRARAEVADDAYLLDVREDDEWAAGHAPGAHHLPMMELPARLAEMPTDGDVVVVCRSAAAPPRSSPT